MWRSWFVATEQKPGGWSRFLKRHSLNEDDLLGLLRFRYRSDARPAWFHSQAMGMRFIQNRKSPPVFQRTIAESLAVPLVAFAWRELEKRLRLLDTKLLSPTAARAMRRSLLRRLVFAGRFAIAWEISATLADATMAPRIQNQRSLQKYFFARGTAHELSSLLSNYPVLARIWFTQIECWAKLTEEFAQHALSFAGNLHSRNTSSHLIENVAPDMSDPHMGNRSVMKVRFRDAREMYYKPRSGRQELTWFKLLARLNEAGFVTPFRILDLHCCGDHCWMEAVRSDSLRSRRVLVERSFRIGALMCLVHLLHGVDFHAENVLGVGSQPVIVDCETLLHPARSLPKGEGDEDASIMRTGFLPRNSHNAGDSENAGTGAGPGVFGALETPRHYVDHIVSGFSTMHRFLTSQPTRLRHIESALSELNDRPTRRVYRPSLHYYYSLERSLQASLLRVGLDRSLFLWASCSNLSGPPIVSKEVEALEDLDMPYFEGKAINPHVDLSEVTLRHSIQTIRRMLM